MISDYLLSQSNIFIENNMERKTSSNPLLFIFFCLFSLNILTAKMAAGQIIPIRVGVVIDMNEYGETVLTCLSMALSDFYATHDHYRTRLVLTNRDSKGEVVGAAAAALDLLKNVQVQAIMGPMYSVQASFLIALGHKAQVPIITFSATSPSLSSFRSPYFIRAALKDSSQVEAMGAIVEKFGWQEVVLVYEDNEFGEGIVPFLTDALENVNARVPYRSVISPQATDDQITAELLNLMTMQTRVFVVHMLIPLASRLFMIAKKKGMMSQEYAWIVTDGITNELSSMNHSAIESMLGVIGVKPHIPKTRELDDFAIRYTRRVLMNNPRASFSGLDIYKLWAHDAAVALAMASEKASLTNATFRETNMSRNSTELEAFGVSESGPPLVQAFSSTRFQGLAGDFRLVDGQLEAPPFEIINMVGPGARGIGYWTKENGLIKEMNFNGGSKPESKLGPIIWPGEGSSPPKGWVIPTNGKKLRVGVPVKDGFTEFVRVTWNSDNSTKVEGYCMDVFEAVMAGLPFGVPYEYIPFATDDHNMAGNYNDLTQQVFLGNFDAVAGDVTIVANRSKYVDFTLPYTESGVAMVVPYEDYKINSAMVITKPLTWEMWLTSLCAFVFIAIVIWILEHRKNGEFKGTFWHQVGTTLAFAFSTIAFAHKERVQSNMSKMVLVLWFFVVLIITQSYTANLASMLTVQKLQPKVNDVKELVKNKDYVGYMKGSFIHGLLIGKMNFEESQLIEFKSMEQLDELLSKGSGNGGISAAFHEPPYIKLFLSNYCPNYTMIPSIYNANGFGLVFPKGSPLVPHVSRSILQVTEGPKMDEIKQKWLQSDKNCPDADALKSPQSLGLQSFSVLFAVVLGFGTIILVIYVVVFLRKNWDGGGQITRERMERLWRRFLNDDAPVNWEDEVDEKMRRIAELLRMNLRNNNNQVNQPPLANPVPNGPP